VTWLIEKDDLHTESQHNIVTKARPNPEDDVMHSQDRAFLIAKYMFQIN